MTLQTTRNDIVNFALTANGVKAVEEDVGGAELEIAAQALDDMVKEWQAAGYHLWTTLSATLFLEKDQKEYTIGPGTTDHATESFSETETTAAISTTDSVFAAVSNTGTGNRAMTSPDGIAWTSRTSAADNSWLAIAYGNGLFVAVSSSGTASNAIMTSSDGITWTSRTAAETNQWNSITFGNGLFVAIASTGTNRVMTSPDGISWTVQSAASNEAWQAVTFGNDTFVATATNGTFRVMTSPDGIIWTSQSASAANNWEAITFGNGLFVAVSTSGSLDRVMTSPDGATWTSQTSASSNSWNGVVFGNNLFVAVSDDGTGDRVMTSPDGETWTSRTSAADNSWQAVAIKDDITILVKSTAGMSIGDNVGVEITTNTLEWTTVTSFTSTSITVDAISDYALAARIYYYTTDMGRALKIPDARRFTQTSSSVDGQEIKLYASARIDYLQLPNKDTSGTPTQYYYQALRTNGKVFIWPVPDNADHRFEFTFRKPLDIFDNAADTADFPNEWLTALKYNLAVRTAPLFGMPQRPDVAAIAASSFQTVLAFDQEDTPLLLTPSRTRTRG